MWYSKKRAYPFENAGRIPSFAGGRISPTAQKSNNAQIQNQRADLFRRAGRGFCNQMQRQIEPGAKPPDLRAPFRGHFL